MLYLAICLQSQGIGLITTGMGIANASASMMAIGLSHLVDLTDCYIIIAGIGGLMPSKGRLGTVVCLRHVINGLCFEIDPRECSEEKPFYKEKLPWLTGTERFTLNQPLVNKCQQIICAHTNVDCIVGDGLSMDAYWHGKRLAQWAEHWTNQWCADSTPQTKNEGNFCISDMENSGILTACMRLADTKRCHFEKVIAIRTASNYVYEPDVAPQDSITKHDSFSLAVEQTYHAVKAIMENLD